MPRGTINGTVNGRPIPSEGLLTGSNGTIVWSTFQTSGVRFVFQHPCYNRGIPTITPNPPAPPANLNGGSGYHLDNLGLQLDPACDPDNLPAPAKPTVLFTGLLEQNVLEGDSGTKQMEFGIVLSQNAVLPVEIRYRTLETGTATAGEDFVPVCSGAVTIPPGEGFARLKVTINGDRTFEPDETVEIRLTRATNATLGSLREATGSIMNDYPLPDPAPTGTSASNDARVSDACDPPTVSIEDGRVVEGHRGSKVMTFNVRLSRPAIEDVTIRYRTVSLGTGRGDARPRQDFVPADNKSLTIKAGEQRGRIQISIVGDTRDEPLEEFGVQLTEATNATLLDRRAKGKIVDDDR